MTEKDIETVEPSEMRLGIIPARTPHDVIVKATAIAKELAGIVKTNNLSRNIQGREYVYVEGWSTMGAMLGVLPREAPELFKNYEDGSCEATVELIRISDGAVIGRASAFVGMDEKDRNGKMTWGNRPLYARRSMAVTRATGKAYRLGFSWIMGLAGYAPTPAEEMDGVIEGVATEVPAGNGHKSEQPPKAKQPGKMSLETAKAVVSGHGKVLGELDVKTLSFMFNALVKRLKDNNLTPEERESSEYERDAIQTILDEGK